LIAISIHSAALVYLPFIFINIKKRNTAIILAPMFIIMFSIITMLNGNEIPYIKSILGLFITNEYILSWFNQNTNLGFLLFWGMHILTFVIIKYSRGIVLNNPLSIDVRQIKFVNLIYWFTLVGFIWFPFYMVSIEFTRLMRNLFILNYITFSITNKAINGYQNKIVYNFVVLLYTVFFFILQIYLPHYESVIKTVLENNYFWK
jgi:hypothetical protein